MAKYPHMPLLCMALVHALVMAPQRRRRNRFVRFWASGGAAKFPKMGDFLPRTPTNHRAIFDAASFILGGEIRNRTNTQKTVIDISTLASQHVWIKKFTHKASKSA